MPKVPVLKIGLFVTFGMITLGQLLSGNCASDQLDAVLQLLPDFPVQTLCRPTVAMLE